VSLRNILQVNLENFTTVTVSIVTVRDGFQRPMENYISLQKSQLLDSLENQVRFSQLVAVLVGEKGIGKSYTLEQLQKRLDDEICIAHIDASMEIQEDQLQKVICLQLGLPSELTNNIEQSDNVQHIEKSIRTHLRKKALISIDNAHLLSNESLDNLLQLNQSQINHQESVLFLLLAGDESLPKNISFTNTFKNHQEMCVVFQLEAIEKSEVGSLVAAISNLSLEEVEERYGAKQLEYFWQLSKGIPAEVEYQVSRWKSETSEEAINIDEIVEENTSYWRGIIYLVLGILFVSILFYQDEINQLIMPENIAKDGVVNIDKNRLDQGNKTKKTINKGLINKKQASKDSIKKYRPIIETPNVANVLELDLGENKKDNLKKKIIDNRDDTSNASTQYNAEIIRKDELQKNAKSKPAVTKVESPTEKSRQEIIVPITKLSLSKDELFLLEQPSAHLSLQWVGVSQLENAEVFRSNHPLKANMYIYRRKQANKNYLYLVVSDLFSKRSDASSARKEYEKLNYQGSPWIKSLSAIQGEIKSL